MDAGKMAAFAPTESTQGFLFLHPSLHFPGTMSFESMLRGITTLLFELLTYDDCVRNGVSVLILLENFGWANFSLETEKVFMEVLQKKFPIRIKKLFLINPPFIMSAILALTTPFLSAKMKERQQKITLEELHMLIPSEDLPLALGGSRVMNVEEWFSLTSEQLPEGLAGLKISDLPDKQQREDVPVELGDDTEQEVPISPVPRQFQTSVPVQLEQGEEQAQDQAEEQTTTGAAAAEEEEEEEEEETFEDATASHD